MICTSMDVEVYMPDTMPLNARALRSSIGLAGVSPSKGYVFGSWRSFWLQCGHASTEVVWRGIVGLH
jgi:hypothetical protein